MKRHRTADLDPTSFGGRYTLLRRLAVGGMAEIYLARQAAMAGFEKEVVIKRLRAELADDPRIVDMFLDEARIGALLNHPNIVHVYDIDEHDGIPYIAMEYIVGEELNELCRRGITHDRFLPLEHAVELMRQAAAGMGYFHAKRSITYAADGSALADRPLDIVHLDISPTNLLVTQDGFLKIIDFGIASAQGQRQRSEVIPGKLGYMSPEQAGRKSFDHRSDIFSLGIVLYEITVGKRLFRGPAHEVVQRLVEAQVEPPTFARRNYPSALEAIVLRALEKHPEDRYQSAYDLADDLEAFLRDQRMHSGPVRIARYLDMLTQAAGGPRRPELAPEQRGTSDELDFDRQVFDAFRPAAGAPGPEQAPEWEDTDQPEADVAAALGMELAELRALRTPVPTRPAGMAEISPSPCSRSRATSSPAERNTVGASMRHRWHIDRVRFALIALALLASGCSDHERRDKPAARDPQPPRRNIQPPTGTVRPLPPHAIRADGVGPYNLGDKVASLLQQLPSGPRIVRFEIPGIVRTSLIRAEDDTVLIGGESTGTATFVAVVGPDVARTEAGIHVGSTLDELARAMGPLADDPDRARDPRIVIPSALRNLRMIVDDGRVSAIVVTSEPTTPRQLPDPPCERPPSPPRSPTAPRRFPACLTSSGEHVEVAGDEVVVRAADGETRITSIRIANLVFAEPIRNLGDNRDEIAVVTSTGDTQERRWSFAAYRLDGTRLVRVVDHEKLYELSSAQARWIGAELPDVDLYLELTSRSDGIEVGGLLTTRADDRSRDVAVISPVVVSRKPGKAAASEPADAAVQLPADTGSKIP